MPSPSSNAPSLVQRVRESGHPVFLLAVLAGAGMLAASGAMKWWHLVNEPEPLYVKAARVLLLLLAGVVVLALLLPRRRAGLLLAAGGAAVALPIVMLMCMVTLDAATVSRAVFEFNQGSAMIANISGTEVAPNVPWTESRLLILKPLVSNRYNFVEGMEDTAAFAKNGWFVSIVGGAIVFLLAWAGDGRQSRRALARSGPFLAGGVAALLLVCFGHLAVSYRYWDAAHTEEAKGNDAAALYDYQQMARWDHRYRYDLTYHLDLGRLYGRLGMRNEPDYWAMIADTYKKTQNYEQACAIYRTHVPNPHVNPVMAVRYAAALQGLAAANYNADLPGLAVARLREAQNLDPNNICLLYALGMALTKTGDYSGAVQTWKTMIANNEGVGLSSSKYYTNAFYRKSISAFAWGKMAWCYYQTAQYGPAMKCRTNAVATGKTNIADVP